MLERKLPMKAHALVTILFGMFVTLSIAWGEVVYQPSQLNARASQLEKEAVTIQGWLVMDTRDGDDEYGIWDDRMHHDASVGSVDSCVAIFVRWADFQRVRKYTHTMVRLTGVFRKSYEKDEGFWLRGTCNLTGIVLPEGGAIEPLYPPASEVSPTR